MEQVDVEKSVLQLFAMDKGRAVIPFKDLAAALSLEKKPKLAKKYLNKMVEDGLLRWHHADTVYYELIS